MAENTKRNYWKYLLYLVLWPFSLSWFIWKREQLSSSLKIGLISIIWFLVIGMTVIQSHIDKSTPSDQATEQENKVINESLASERQTFDSEFGSNYEAAATAKGVKAVFEETYPDIHFQSHVVLKSDKKAEQDYLSGLDLKKYRPRVSEAIMGVVLSESWWKLQSDSAKSTLLSQWATTLSSLYPEALVTISVGNGSTEYAKATKFAKQEEIDVLHK